ncbi:hypothetical protein PHLGIDRAFT_129707 [Phlebiopsis gigantea 11061_1 CR5-6]|uniref:Uncharacterized protein n=1 Tax=Phlebiopsis gigantea (strain 11061_1 CR5-6) TaxID=745531 RepID=A0A0C3RTP2_PHLG1|nr:hypothetical protein PHLGIDRAFT_129707 [Phlebiopsis gigantea 11061_1 CR5-6]
MSSLWNILVKWTGPAEAEVSLLGPDVKAEAEERVKEHAQEYAPDATQARIRKPYHVGGNKPSEPEHLTVTYKQKNRDLGAWHVYRDKALKSVQVNLRS